MALHAAGAYVAISVLWILLSDALVATLISDPTLQEHAQSFKGVFFVVTSGVLLYFLMWQSLRQAARANQEIAEQRERQRLAIRAARIGYWAWDPRTDEFTYYGGFARMFGRMPPKSGTLSTFLKLVHPEDHSIVHEALKRTRDEQVPYDAEFRVYLPDRSIRWISAKGDFVRDAAGNLLRMTGIHIDISELKEIQQELREAIQVRDEFISIASHELKTPLTSIKLQAQLFAKRITQRPGPVDPEETRQLLRIVNRQTDRLARLTEDMLDISRIATGRITMKAEPIDLAQLIRGVAENLAGPLEESHSRLELELEPGIAGRWDRLRLEQVVENLLSNAIKFGKGNPIRIQSRRVWIDRSERAEISFRDHGIGVAKEDQERIFGRFERAVPSANISGMGLGLYISTHILRAHGGSIALRSEPGKGATFTVRLPITAPERQANPHAA